MKRVIYIFCACLLTFACKNQKNKEEVENKFETGEITKKDSALDSVDSKGRYELPRYYNPVQELGKGLLKPKRDTLLFGTSSDKISHIESIYNPKSIIPIFFKPDYNIFYIVCIAETNRNYEILSGNSKKLYVNKLDFEFISWESFLNKTTGIENIDWNKNPLRKEPNSGAIIVSTKSKEDFVINKIQGNWIEIQNEEKDKGWIKWKENEKLLIEIYLLM